MSKISPKFKNATDFYPDHLSVEQERALIEQYQRDGDEPSFNQLYKSYELYIKQHAHIGCRKYKHLSIDDCMVAATRGFLKAVRKFDPEFDCRLSTYSRGWMLSELQQDANEYSSRKFTQHKFSGQVMRMISDEIGKEHAWHPNIPEIIEKTAKRLRTDTDIIEKLYNAATLTPVPMTVVTDKNEEEFERSLTYDTDSAEDILERKQMSEILHEALASLSEKEREVIFRSYGIGRESMEEETGREIGQSFGVSSQRIQQVRTRAQSKLTRFFEVRGFEIADP